MRKAEVNKHIEKMLRKVLGDSSPDAYFYGYKEGCYNLLGWLVEQGIIEGS